MEELILVLYHPKMNQIQLYKRTIYHYHMGEPFVVWQTLDAALYYGWEVIGEL